MKNLISCFTAVILCQGLIAQPCMTLTMSSVQASCSTCTDATATVTATGGTVPYTYQWDGWTGSQTTQTATGLTTGNYYSVTVTDSSGCYENDGIVICDTSMPSFTYVVYGQDSVVFTNTSSAGNGWYSISFGDGTSFPGAPFSYWTSNSISHVYNTPGTYNVCLYDTFMNCTQSFFCDSVTITSCQANLTYWMSGVWCLVDFTATGATSYNWDFGDGTQGNGSQINSHQFPSTDTFNVCLYAIDGGGDTCDISCEQIFVDCGTGLTEFSQNKIQVYPNPTKGILTIEGMEGIAKVYDIYGRLVLTAISNKLDISEVADGIYFVRVLDEEGKMHTAKVFKE